MAKKVDEKKFGAMSDEEIALAKVLLHNKKINEAQLGEFVILRSKFDKMGKRYLGDVLISRKIISKKILNEFFKKNNKLYLEFLKDMTERGFLVQAQYDKIMRYKESKVNVVLVIEKLRIMTKESFMKLFSHMVQSFRLGEWLIANKKVDKKELKDALKEQSISDFGEYVVYYSIIDKKVLDHINQTLGLH